MRIMLRSSSVAVGLAALLAMPAVASSQTFYGVSGGLEATYPGLRYFTVQGSIGRRISPRVEVRVEAFVSHWDEVFHGGGVFVLCPFADLRDCAPGPDHNPRGVGGLAGNGLLYIAPPLHGPQAYLIGGWGAYFLAHPQMGFSAGVGGSIPIGPQTRVVLEARYHFLLSSGELYSDPPAGSKHLIPITLGVRF